MPDWMTSNKAAASIMGMLGTILTALTGRAYKRMRDAEQEAAEAKRLANEANQNTRHIDHNVNELQKSMRQIHNHLLGTSNQSK